MSDVWRTEAGQDSYSKRGVERDGTKGGDEDDRGDYGVNLPKVDRKGTAKEQERKLEQ